MTDTRKDALVALREKVAAGDAAGGQDWPLVKRALGSLQWFHQAYHGSLDAAKALHEAVLPGWVWLCRSGDDEDAKHNPPHGGPDRFLANVWRDNQQPNEGHLHCPEWAANPARAWLLAILSALIAEGEGA